MRYMFALIFVTALAVPFSALAAELTVIDGDTFRMGRNTISIENIDAPETHEAKCDAERQLGKLAAARLSELLSGGRIELTLNQNDGRDEDRYGRKLRRVVVNGVDAGETLVKEGLARTWDGRRHPWC